MKSLITGTPADRVAGLEPVLNAARGKTVLDIGCHKGFVALQFALAGAAEIHGFDRFEFGIEMTKGMLEEFPIPSNIRVLDLTQGRIPAEAGLLEKFDIVLYLGVDHHLRRASTERRMKALLDQLLALSREYFVVRTSDDLLDALAPAIKAAGFVAEHYSAINKKVSPVVIYRRTN